jgi:Flp pilus assembly protein TadG
MSIFFLRGVVAARAKSRALGLESSGGVLVTFALAMIPVMLTLGVALDYGRAARARSSLQEAADSAAIAAARLPGATQSARLAAAQKVALSNIAIMGLRVTPTVTEAESSGNYQVTITGAMPTTFMQLAHINSVPITATSTATNNGPGITSTQSTTTPANVCILAVGATRPQAFLANSGATIDAPTCEVDVASTAAPAAILNSGASFTLSSMCIAGANIINNGATVTNGASVLKLGCNSALDPFAAQMPSVNVGPCTVSNQNYSGSVTLQPGVYCGGFNFNGSGTITLSPGLYIFKGVSWNLNSGWTMVGSGVTLYFADSSYLQFNGTAGVVLSAPTTGTYANILMFEGPGLATSAFTINGAATSADCLTGLIHLPSRDITFNSGANVNSASITMVMNTLILDGVTWNLKPSAFNLPSASSTVTTTTSVTIPSPSHLIR